MHGGKLLVICPCPAIAAAEAGGVANQAKHKSDHVLIKSEISGVLGSVSKKFLN